jgi:hypothetical protein
VHPINEACQTILRRFPFGFGQKKRGGLRMCIQVHLLNHFFSFLAAADWALAAKSAFFPEMAA